MAALERGVGIFTEFLIASMHDINAVVVEFPEQHASSIDLPRPEHSLLKRTSSVLLLVFMRGALEPESDKDGLIRAATRIATTLFEGVCT